jgi:hypothetical protein
MILKVRYAVSGAMKPTRGHYSYPLRFSGVTLRFL